MLEFTTKRLKSTSFESRLKFIVGKISNMQQSNQICNIRTKISAEKSKDTLFESELLEKNLDEI